VAEDSSAAETTDGIDTEALTTTWVDSPGRVLVDSFTGLHQLSAFMLITLAVSIRKFNVAEHVVHPIIRAQIVRAGARLLPMMTFLGGALGLVVIGQSVFLLNRLGAESYAGSIMVTAVVREMGPMLAAMLVLGRVGAENVIELGTARALGEVEALEALGIDPIHYLVMPRIMGMAAAICALTVYGIVVALLSGYVFAFLENVPLRPTDYFAQLSASLLWEDFVLLTLKALAFGALIGGITCFEGLAHPLHIEEVSSATTRAVGKCVVGVVLLDALFILIYLFL
jgi:phospholipid/cholesterol/gamma-HCH transport system permease protein